jgi:hypothetical protein
MAFLGEYYALKIEGALQLALYREGGDRSDGDKALRSMELALEAWKAYADTAMGQYLPQVYARTGSTDLHALTGEVEKDLEWVRKSL